MVSSLFTRELGWFRVSSPAPSSASSCATPNGIAFIGEQAASHCATDGAGEVWRVMCVDGVSGGGAGQRRSLCLQRRGQNTKTSLHAHSGHVGHTMQRQAYVATSNQGKQRTKGACALLNKSTHDRPKSTSFHFQPLRKDVLLRAATWRRRPARR